MKLKSLLLIVALLAVVSALVFVIQRPGASVSDDVRIGRALSQGVAIEQAAKLHLTDQGKSVMLVRQADGTWRVSSYYDLPADFTKLSAFVSSTTDVVVQRLVTSNAERIARLEFKDTKIELLDATDKELWSVTLGKNAEMGGGRYVRFGNEQKAYLANFTAWLDADSKNWADGQILNLKSDDIAAVEIPFGENNDIKISRQKTDAPWTSDKTPAGQQINATKVASILTSTGTVRFLDTTEPTDVNALAAKSHERTLKLLTFSGKTYTIALGRKPEEKKPKPVTESAPAPLPNMEIKPGATNLDQTKTVGTNQKPAEPKQAVSEFETIPAGPVFVFIGSSDASDPINGLMQKRAFQISDYTFNGLPQKAGDLFEPVPALPSPAPVPEKPATAENIPALTR